MIIIENNHFTCFHCKKHYCTYFLTNIKPQHKSWKSQKQNKKCKILLFVNILLTLALVTISAPNPLADVAIDSDTAPIPPENRENDENRYFEEHWSLGLRLIALYLDYFCSIKIYIQISPCSYINLYWYSYLYS